MPHFLGQALPRHAASSKKQTHFILPGLCRFTCEQNNKRVEVSRCFLFTQLQIETKTAVNERFRRIVLAGPMIHAFKSWWMAGI